VITGNAPDCQIIRTLPVLFEIVVVVVVVVVFVVVVVVVNLPSTDVTDPFRRLNDFNDKRVRTCPLTWLILMYYVSVCANIHFFNVG